jgi:3-oxoacyl-[acyl-carrier protein] reductase
VDEVWNALGGIDCLANNAGVSVSVRDDLLKMTPESYDRVMRINLRGPYFLTQEVDPADPDTTQSFRPASLGSSRMRR